MSQSDTLFSLSKLRDSTRKCRFRKLQEKWERIQSSGPTPSPSIIHHAGEQASFTDDTQVANVECLSLLFDYVTLVVF